MIKHVRGQVDCFCSTEWKMIRMSLDTETVLPHELSPAFPGAVGLSEQPQPAKTRPLLPKNGLQLPGNSQAPVDPVQRIAKRRYSMGVGFKGLAKRRYGANISYRSWTPQSDCNFHKFWLACKISKSYQYPKHLLFATKHVK